MDQSIRLIEHDPAASAALMDANELGGHPHDDNASDAYKPAHGGYPDASIVATTDVVAPSKPFMQALAEAAVQPLVPAPQFVLVLQDTVDAETGAPMIEMAGVQRPEAFDHTSPSHVVGTWIRAHLPEILQAARSATVAQPQQLRLPDGSLVGPRTLLIG